MKKLEVIGLCKSYGSERVFKDYNAFFSDEHINCIMGESGIGKSTLLGIIMGTNSYEAGSIVYKVNENVVDKFRMSAVFQESSLVGHLNPIINIKMVTGNTYTTQQIKEVLTNLLGEEDFSKPCDEFSGGMKRRIEIARAVMYKSDIVIMDEPFSALDEYSKDKVIKYILQNMSDRIFIISTHSEKDIKKLSASVLFIDNKAGSCYNNV